MQHAYQSWVKTRAAPSMIRGEMLIGKPDGSRTRGVAKMPGWEGSVRWEVPGRMGESSR